MKQSTKDILSNIVSSILMIYFVLASLMAVLLYVERLVSPDTKLIRNHSDTLIDHDQRLLSLEAWSWDTDEINDSIDSLRKELHDSIKDVEKNSNAKIYNIEVTVCLFDEEANEVHKRKVIMNDIIAINPSVERTATVVDTGLWYGLAQVEIPTISDSEDEYACWLKILSIK